MDIKVFISALIYSVLFVVKGIAFYNKQTLVTYFR